MRITPADAGKTSICAVRQTDTEDHPRRCGENFTHVKMKKYFMGSPPQVRGKLLAAIAVSVLGRITPAGAGKTRRRERGEGVYLGSPPRMRGKLIGYIIPLSVKKSNI